MTENIEKSTLQPLSFYSSIIEELIKSFNKCLEANVENIKEYNNFASSFQLGFNIFTLISDLYYRENFNNDIFCTFLKLKEENKLIYLDTFIDFLNENYESKLNKTDFEENTVIEREKGHIDILIRNENSKKAIIIESKINNAVDQYRQLPRYKEDLKDKGYEVVAIVYLVVDVNKEPNQTGWDKEEINDINPILKIIPAYKTQTTKDKPKDDLYSWLLDCTNKSSNIDILSVFRQYAQLIKYLGGNAMNDYIMSKFLDEIKKEKYNYNQLKSFHAMLNEMPVFRANLIKKHYEDNMEKLKPFKKVWRFFPNGNRCVVLDNFIYNDNHIAIDILANNWQETHYSYAISIFIRDKAPEKTKEELKFLEDEELAFWGEKGDWKRYEKIIKIHDTIEESQAEFYKFMDDIFLPRLRKLSPTN